MRRVGAEISTTERWKGVGNAYAKGIDGGYHQHRLAVIRTLLPDLKRKSVVDFGCGEGVLIRMARDMGAAKITGIDIDAALLEMAKTAGAAQLFNGGVERLGDMRDADCLIAANVATYFTDDENAKFYEYAARALRPGGHLVITHSNELFDFFTLNVFTVEFFKRNFAVDISTLLRHPDIPDRMSFNIRENPLSYPAKLAVHGFMVERTEYMNLHRSPPLLSGDDPDDMGRPKPDTLTTPETERWKLIFQCSMFGLRARRI